MKNNLILDQLNKWIEDSEKQAEIFHENKMNVAELTSNAMAQAYWNVKQFIEVNLKKEDNNANIDLVAFVDKQIELLSDMLMELMIQDIKPDDFNEISEKITDLKVYMINCHSYNNTKK
jgi:hypothetical protein